MEITKTVSAMKTTMTQLEKTLECDMRSISGQDQETVELIDSILADARLQSFFQIEDDDELRKLHFLLFLNAGLKFPAELETDDNVGHIVGAIPRLSSRLYFALVKHFNLFKYLNETLRFCPIVMMVKLLEVIDIEMKYLSGVERYEILGNALEIVSTRLIETDDEFFLKELADNFQALMLHFKKLAVDNEESAKKDDVQRVDEGFKFASLISLLLSLTENVFGEPALHESSSSSSSLYEMATSVHSSAVADGNELKPKSDIIRLCYENVFFKCRELIEDIDLDTFLTWYETPVKGTNLQTFVGEKVFHLCRLLEKKQSSSNLLPDETATLISMLQCVSMEPADTAKETNGTNYDSLEALILRDDIFDKPILQRIEDFLEDCPAAPDLYITLIRKLLNVERRPEPYVDVAYLQKIILLALQQLETHHLIVLLDEFITKYGLNHFMIKDDNDYIYSMKLLSSYFTKDDIDSEAPEEDFVHEKEKQILKDVALMGFHTSHVDFKTMIREACTDRHDVVVLIKILETLKVICSFKPMSESASGSHSVLIIVLKEFLEVDYRNLTLGEKNKFNSIVISLSNRELLNVDDFLSLCLLPLLYMDENSDLVILSELLLLFKDFIAEVHRDLSLCWPILLAQIAQILEDSRWSMSTFSEERVTICQRAIDAVEELLKHCKEVTTSIRRLMESQFKTYSSLTRSYLTKVWQSDAAPSIDDKLAKLIHEPPQSQDEFMKDYSENQDAYVVKMGELLLCCTREEIQRIVDNFTHCEIRYITFISDWISDSITFISNTVWHFAKQNVEFVQVVYACLGTLVRNFLCVLLKNVTAAAEFDYIKYVNRLVIVVKKFPENRSSICQFNILKFLVDEVPKLNKLSHDFEDQIRKLLTGLYVL